MRRIKLAVASVVMILSGVAFSHSVMAAGTCPTGSKNETYTNNIAECNMEVIESTSDNSLMKRVQTIINVVLGAVGLVAVVMIILGGVQYTTSAGDAGKVKKAKDTIMYGVIGMLIALLAFAIVNFVLSGVFGGSSSSGDKGEKKGEDDSTGLVIDVTA